MNYPLFEQVLYLFKENKSHFKQISDHAKYVDSIKNEEEMSRFVKGLLKQKNSVKTFETKKG